VHNVPGHFHYISTNIHFLTVLRQNRFGRALHCRSCKRHGRYKYRFYGNCRTGSDSPITITVRHMRGCILGVSDLRLRLISGIPDPGDLLTTETIAQSLCAKRLDFSPSMIVSSSRLRSGSRTPCRECGASAARRRARVPLWRNGRGGVKARKTDHVDDLTRSAIMRAVKDRM
jgi:hypothetical protein